MHDIRSPPVAKHRQHEAGNGSKTHTPPLCAGGSGKLRRNNQRALKKENEKQQSRVEPGRMVFYWVLRDDMVRQRIVDSSQLAFYVNFLQPYEARAGA